MSAHETLLDTKGLLCPLPVLKARKALEGLRGGDVLVMEATDPAAVIDVPHYCQESGHTLLGHEAVGGVHRFRIEKKR